MRAAPGGASPPSLAACWVLLVLVDAVLRLRGLRGALRLADRLAPMPVAVQASGSNAPVVRPRQAALVTARRVAAAGSFYPRRALCLEQSLVLVVLLRRRGIAAELRLGVQPLPFLAHAWVEVDGTAINEPADLIGQLVAFPAEGA
jgi:hypothetical protein